MNLGAARAELMARGFDYMSTSRANTFLNNANHEFNEFASWYWLELTASGPAPYLPPAFRDILYVVDLTTGTELRNIDQRDMIDMDPGRTATGSPIYYWLDNQGNGTQKINVWPGSTDNIEVRIIQVAPDVLVDTDVPVIPARYHSTWVDLAQARVLMNDNSNDSLATQIKQQAYQDLQQTAQVLMNQMYDNPSVQVMNSDPDSTIWRGGF